MGDNLREAVEGFWLAAARRALGLVVETHAGEVLEKIRPMVAELSDLFTVARPKIFRDYMSNARNLAAYGLFFFPQSFARAEFVARRLLGFCRRHHNEDCHNGGGDCGGNSGGKIFRILDLGSGPAPCGLAFATVLHEKFPEARIEIVAVDRSRGALDAAVALAREISRNGGGEDSGWWRDWLTVATQVADLKNFAGTAGAKFDFVVVGWALNEIAPAEAPDGVERALVFLKKLAPSLSPAGTLVVMEPAQKEPAERLQRVGDYFARMRGLPFFRVAPELGDHADPLLAEGGEMWNHEVRNWVPPATLEFLNRKLFRDIGVLKFSWRALATEPFELPPLPAGASAFLRLISPMEITKPALRFTAVDVAGNKLQIEIPARDISKNERKRIVAGWERGDIAALAGTLCRVGNSEIFRLAGRLIKVA